jgi:hypothetical protein
LKAEVLQKGARLPALHLLGENLVVSVDLTSAVNIGQGLEEEPRAPQEAREATIATHRQRVYACVHISEVLPEKSSHVFEEVTVIGQGRTRERGRAEQS